ncbi:MULTISPECIES: hypothetical protein [Sphingobacterium]|uniref:hypothetical protein n=1 Tax=Sphingobacterium TaxID=28453 RepID=UPI00190F1F78|nr:MULTISPECIES: hypothetical protein [Sphingobacterium]MCS4165389.1 hypothetical protein [Sphingobacterium sp. BIGb0116]WSO12645.1 hypothetical protein VUL84_14935 [Sphingobacterium paramultivorum]
MIDGFFTHFYIFKLKKIIYGGTSIIDPSTKMTKLKCIILLLFFNRFMAVGQDAIRINHLPFIQGLTEQSVSIIWTTDKPATGWV